MEIAIDTEGGRVNALCALPSAYVSSPSAILLGSQNGSCSVWQTRTVAARAEDGRAQASGRLADAAPGPSFALDKLSSIFVSRSPVRCLDIASFDGTLLGVAGADDATITLLKLTSGSGFDAEIASSTPEIIQRVSVPASAAPTALCVDSVNELIMSGDARGGIALYNLRHMTAAPFYAGTLEGGSGPNILDAIFWTYSPQSFIVAASTNVYLVDARVAPDAACGLIALSVKIPSPSGSTVVSVDVFADDPWLVVYGSEDGSLGVADMRRPTVPWAFTQAHNGPGKLTVVLLTEVANGMGEDTVEGAGCRSLALRHDAHLMLLMFLFPIFAVQSGVCAR